MRKLFALVAAAVLFAVPGISLAAPAGQSVGVDPAAAARLGNEETRVLKVGADVFIGDIIQTGARGQVQILFADNTELVLGPNTTLKIDDYLLRNNGSAGKLAVDMLSGAFRFATGDSAKNLYSISTPTGTIGVRGTEFDVDVNNGVTQIMVYEGSVRFCTLDGQCKTLNANCEVGVLQADTAEVLGSARALTPEERVALQEVFRYAMNQSPLLPEFRFDNVRQCLTVVVPPPIPRADPTPPSNDNNYDGGEGECGEGSENICAN